MALVSILGSPGLAAEEWDDFRTLMGAYTSTVEVSERLASSQRKDGSDELGDLAIDVRRGFGDRYLRLVREGYALEPEPGQSEREHFDALVAHVSKLNVFADDQKTRAAMESLGACETAGILVRSLALQVADGEKQIRQDDGRTFIDGTNYDERYALALARCQIIKRHPLTPAAIGYSQTACEAIRHPECPIIIDR